MSLGRIEDYNKNLPIVEIYTAVQSEGSRAGYPTVVIRTTGCTHRCYFGEGGWCDSWYTSIHPEKGKYIEGYEQKPIKWVRIHNLPDLAYFNHSQHVVAGGLECQECHGAIEEMEVVEQHSSLTMGWCIECHRNTEVKVADNDYYEEMHAKFKENHPGETFNVEAIGGLECGKCHY